MALQCGPFSLRLEYPALMGVLNVTPDSFSDGGRFTSSAGAIAHAHRMLEEGADILDIGGESSRPGAQAISEEEEMRRVLPVLDGLRGLNVPISVDTRRPRVMQEALRAGASMINDIEALALPGALEAVSGDTCAVCLMHKRGDPATMQKEPRYGDVVREVHVYLEGAMRRALSAGIARGRIVADVGFGFGKTVAHNFELLRRLHEFSDLGVPLVAGWSRKSALGAVTGRPVGERLAASVAAAVLAAQGGAKILRVHDVRETRDALAVLRATTEQARAF